MLLPKIGHKNKTMIKILLQAPIMMGKLRMIIIVVVNQVEVEGEDTVVVLEGATVVVINRKPMQIKMVEAL